MHMTENPVAMEDITFYSLENSMLAVDHIIICGIVDNINSFIQPLRASHLKEPSPIVILNDEPISSRQWEYLNNFTQIYFVQGSPLSEEAFDRVNLMEAK